MEKYSPQIVFWTKANTWKQSSVFQEVWKTLCWKFLWDSSEVLINLPKKHEVFLHDCEPILEEHLPGLMIQSIPITRF